MTDSFKSKGKLSLNGKQHTIFRLNALENAGLSKIEKLPFSIRILLENLLRREDGQSVREDDIKALAAWNPAEKSKSEIAFTPSRVVLQDFTGVPAVVDLAAMRDQITSMQGDASKINPLEPVDLVIDHSVQVDFFGSEDSFEKNVSKEFERNGERYKFLRWGQQAFENFRVVPPGTGIVHQVNLEYLAHVVMTKQVAGETLAYPDSLVGTDSHTTMINGLGVLGWGVGGIEAEAAMLGQPISMLIPEVVGFKLTGKLPEGATATDLVLTVTQMLREKGVVGKFVEFFGTGLDALTLADRATIANMAPEYGATMGFFPVDQETLSYLKLTGRDHELAERVETYLREQQLFRTSETPDPEYSDTLELDLATIEPSIAGPKRPQDRIRLKESKTSFEKALKRELGDDFDSKSKNEAQIQNGASYSLKHGSVVIGAITSCTNTSNPSVLIGAGLLAKKAYERGLMTKPWVKTSLAPGSQVVTDYLTTTGLLEYLEKMKFNLVGYGCTTCIGNSGPLPEKIASAIGEKDLVATAVLSGNRNFEGRISPHVRANYLASPALVVAYSIAGTMDIDLLNDPIGKDKEDKDVYLKDLWPSNQEIKEILKDVTSEMFQKRYANVFEGTKDWKEIDVGSGKNFEWDEKSTYVKRPPFFEGMQAEPESPKDIEGAKVLVMVGDSVTTDHISPAGSIPKDSPAAKYLIAQGVQEKDFNSFGSRRGNHEVMMRGTFGNIRLRNLLAPGTEGGFTKYNGQVTSIYEAAMNYAEKQVPTLVLAGKEYGTGSSRDWAAKGPALLGVRAVIAESYERIHRSNLIGMGILPLQFKDGESRESLAIEGHETFDISGINESLKPGAMLTVKVKSESSQSKSFECLCRIDTPVELEYFKHGGILKYVLRKLLGES